MKSILISDGADSGTSTKEPVESPTTQMIEDVAIDDSVEDIATPAESSVAVLKSNEDTTIIEDKESVATSKAPIDITTNQDVEVATTNEPVEKIKSQDENKTEMSTTTLMPRENISLMDVEESMSTIVAPRDLSTNQMKEDVAIANSEDEESLPSISPVEETTLQDVEESTKTIKPSTDLASNQVVEELPDTYTAEETTVLPDNDVESSSVMMPKNLETTLSDIEESITTTKAPTEQPTTKAAEEAPVTDSIQDITTPPEIKVESSTILLESTVPPTNSMATDELTTSNSMDEITTKLIENESPITTTAVPSSPGTEEEPVPTSVPEIPDETTTLSEVEIGKGLVSFLIDLKNFENIQ